MPANTVGPVDTYLEQVFPGPTASDSRLAEAGRNTPSSWLQAVFVKRKIFHQNTTHCVCRATPTPASCRWRLTAAYRARYRPSWELSKHGGGMIWSQCSQWAPSVANSGTH